MLKVNGSIWIESSKGTFIGQGRMVLLEKIDEYGSISEAAKSMRMSYKKAWEMIDSMNKQTSKPLVVKVSGGKGGGGTVVTDNGKQLLVKYKKLLEAFNKFAEKQTGLLT